MCCIKPYYIYYHLRNCYPALAHLTLISMFLQLLEELHEKQTQEAKMHEELESLKESLRSGKQNLVEVASDRERLKSLCDEKDKALQVSEFAGLALALVELWHQKLDMKNQCVKTLILQLTD